MDENTQTSLNAKRDQNGSAYFDKPDMITMTLHMSGQKYCVLLLILSIECRNNSFIDLRYSPNGD